jgi:hypothetical protein
MGVLTSMRSIWESIVRWLAEADDEGDDPNVVSRLRRAHAAMAAKGLSQQAGSNQQHRDTMARIMQDPHAAKLLAQPPEDWEGELGGQSSVKGTSEPGPEDLPKPIQAAPGTSSGIGAGRIAAKNAIPTSVSLGARGRQVDPGVSGIKQRYGVNADDYYADAPVKVDPKTGKQYPLRGRPQKGQPSKDQLQLKQEPFAAQHAAAAAKNAMKQAPDRSKIHTYDAGPFKDSSGLAHKPQGGTIRQTGKAQGIGTSTAGSSKLTGAGGERKSGVLGQRFAPAGHTAADEEEWASNPALAARRMGGKGGAKLSYGRQDVGQRGRMTVPANAGKGTATFYNPYTGENETEDEFHQNLKRPDIKAQIAAKLAMRGADISNKRFGDERRPHASRASAEPLGNVLPKDAKSQKDAAAIAAVASKPLPVNTRRGEEEPPKHQYKPEPTQQGQSGGSAGSSGDGPIDRSKMKQMIAQRMAAMAAKRAGNK